MFGNRQKSSNAPTGSSWAGTCTLRFGLGALLLVTANWTVAQSSSGQAPVAVNVRAGEVVFVAGAVSKRSAGSITSLLSKGDFLLQGDQIQASDNGYVYVRMTDGGLLVVRPKSSLQIDRWQYDPVNPAASQIKYTLTNGVARYVSGRGSHAAKDGFRFNTPIAAIGVRGTDFTVLAESALTRVVVRSGGVVVSPLGGACRADALGPCDGASATELFASAREKMIQIRRGDQRPELVDTNIVPPPDKSNPPAVSEPTASIKSPVVTEAAVQDYRARQIGEALSSPIQPEPELAYMNPVWGRFATEPGSMISPASYASVVNGRSLVASNRSYVLAISQHEGMALPGDGIGEFKLVAHQGVVTDALTSRIVDSTATNASLRIDFASRTFQTDFDLKANDLSARVVGVGSVGADGTMLSTPFRSPALVQGVATGTEAAYLYQQSLSPTLGVSGAMSWKK